LTWKARGVELAKAKARAPGRNRKGQQMKSLPRRLNPITKWGLQLRTSSYVTSIADYPYTLHLHPSHLSLQYCIYTMAMLIPLLLPHVVAAGANIGMSILESVR
jgi:hypothetical protein